VSISIKVFGGTASSDEKSLCLSCKRATIIRGQALDEEIIECGALSGGGDRLSGGGDRIRFKVTSCNAYRDSAQPSLQDMQELAWVLKTDNRTRTIGFVPAKKLSSAERYSLTEYQD